MTQPNHSVRNAEEHSFHSYLIAVYKMVFVYRINLTASPSVCVLGRRWGAAGEGRFHPPYDRVAPSEQAQQVEKGWIPLQGAISRASSQARSHVHGSLPSLV